MSMFDTYKELPEGYIPNNIKPTDNLSCAYPTNKLEPCRPTKPYEEYNTEGQLIGYYWYYGDEVNLEFNISGELTLLTDEYFIQLNELLSSKKAVIRLLDFRNNIIVEKVLDASTNVVFQVDKELSKQLVRGVYYCTLTIVGDDFQKTIFSNEDAVFNVK